MHHCEFEHLESRRLMSFDVPLPAADLLADTNRDGVIDSRDDKNESIWKPGKSGQGAVILPNFDKDNPGAAPDNWTGGVWNGRPAAPNNVIDNAADLLDVGRLRLRMLNTDDSYNYRVTLQLLKPASGDPAWFKNAAAADRVRVFMPSKQLASGDVVPQAGDVAVMGPGLGDTIVFTNAPAGVHDYRVQDLAGNGWFEFGVEGVKAGAVVRFKVTIEYIPVFESQPGDPADPEPPPPPSVSDEVAVRVAPFVLSDNRQAADKVIVENMNRFPGFDNAEARAAIKKAFGSKVIESQSGDPWQQDGYEIGYVKAPYGQMPVVLELPRARNGFFGQENMRSFVRSTLLKAGVGVSTELAALAIGSASTYGGDIESLPRPGAPAGAPGYLLSSGMPAPMRDFFAAQNVNPVLDLKLDDWMGVAHVDEVVQLGADGKHVLVADTELAWALSLWAVKLNLNVRMHPKMNGNEALPGYTAEGILVRDVLANGAFRKQNLEFAQSASRLRGVFDTLRRTLGLTNEVSAPTRSAANTGSVALARAGAFVQMLGNVKRTFEVRFLDADRYQLRYQDAGKAPSKWFDGRKSRDEVFTEAKAYLLKHVWSGAAKAGDTFTFSTNPAATLVKMPNFFATFGVLQEPGTSSTPVGDWRLIPYSTNHINALTVGTTVVTGKAFGPKVNFDGRGNSDLFEAYSRSAFRAAGYQQVIFTDSRQYHEITGDLHCGTNVIRSAPSGKWWDA
ncbi:MAG TPA: protein-arginine deiminase family protein [Tepidisphaeraceae bacterium]|nr:protein-arginine deiminase family protein [Tepidisphaeraceae bacterium]